MTPADAVDVRVRRRVRDGECFVEIPVLDWDALLTRLAALERARDEMQATDRTAALHYCPAHRTVVSIRPDGFADWCCETFDLQARLTAAQADAARMRDQMVWHEADAATWRAKCDTLDAAMTDAHVCPCHGCEMLRRARVALDAAGGA